MRRDYQKGKVLARGKDVCIGIDVHKEKWHVTARVEGEEVFHGGMLSEYQSLRKFLERFKGSKIKVAYEAGPCGFGLYDKLSADGIETIVVPPSLIPVESGNKVKTDKRDSRKLAKLLESNMLKKVYVLTEEDRANRELVRTRRQLMEHRGDVMRQIKSKLLFHDIKSPFPSKQRWTKGYVKWLRELHLEHEVVKVSFNTLIDLYGYLGSQLIKISKEVIALSQSDKYSHKVKLLRSVPGIGILIAMELLVELPDIERFKTADEIASYMGLTPSEYSTGVCPSGQDHAMRQHKSKGLFGREQLASDQARPSVPQIRSGEARHTRLVQTEAYIARFVTQPVYLQNKQTWSCG